ncbi:putative uncharacterized protein [Acidaminococcus sp. CAG:917]|nr:putative uncharacterized protein [Acidaminococcus sp. CAG:917]
MRNAKNTRMCAVCRKRADKSQFIKVCEIGGEAVVNGTGAQKGKGVYICPECVSEAIKRKTLSRAFKKEVASAVYAELENYGQKKDN